MCNMATDTKSRTYKRRNDDDDDEDRPIIAKTPTDLQRLRLEKLMKHPEKPVPIPERPKEKNTPHVPDFVRNVMGSSAGAGSGEFHVYRHLRRKEYARQKFIQERAEKELRNEEYHQKLEENKKAAEERTAKKRAKRLKKKQRQKQQQKKKLKSESVAGTEMSESASEGSDEEEGSGKAEPKAEAEPEAEGKTKAEVTPTERDNLEADTQSNVKSAINPETAVGTPGREHEDAEGESNSSREKNSAHASDSEG